MKNILHVSTSKGGVESYINSIINNSKSFSHNLAVPLGFQTENENTLLCFIGSDSKLISDVKNIFSIIKSINTYNTKINLLHGHSSKGILYSCIIGLYFRIPVIASPHAFGFYRFEGIKKSFVTFVEYLIYNFFNCYLLSSNKSERTIGENRFFIKKNIIKESYYNSIKPTNYNKKFFKNNNSKITVLFVGRITYQKNPEKYLYLAKKIKEIIPYVNFLLVGGGFDDILTHEEKELKKKAKDNLIIIDWVSENDLIKILKESDIYVSTSRYEGLPTSTLLAMNYQLPIISTKTPGNEDLVIDGFNGFLSNDTDTLVKNIKELIYNDKLRMKFGKNSKMILNKRFNLERNILMLEKIYSSYIR